MRFSIGAEITVPTIGTFLIVVEIIIFNLVILPIGEVSKMKLLKVDAFQSEKDEQFKMELLKV